MIPHYLYQSISLIYKGGPPKAQNLFIKNCIFILTCSNFSHLQSTLLLRQYTYWDIFFKRDFIFTERGSEREREERNISVWLPLTCPLLGDLACNPGMCPDWESNQRPFGLQSSTQFTEPHQPGQIKYVSKVVLSVGWRMYYMPSGGPSKGMGRDCFTERTLLPLRTGGSTCMSRDRFTSRNFSASQHWISTGVAPPCLWKGWGWPEPNIIPGIQSMERYSSSARTWGGKGSILAYQNRTSFLNLYTVNDNIHII